MSRICKIFMCKIFGHKFIYNFKWMPSRCMCKRCYVKFNYDVTKLEWNKAESFPENLGTDSEISDRWIS